MAMKNAFSLRLEMPEFSVNSHINQQQMNDLIRVKLVNNDVNSNYGENDNEL